MQSNYIISFFHTKDFKDYEKAEVVFMGRSNSGKSSLINAVSNRKKLARASQKPGSTQGINLYDVQKTQDCSFILVDFPGYGFHKAPKKAMNQWAELTGDFLQRESIVALCFLADARRLPDDFELQYLQSIRESVKLVYVMTKIDKSTQKELSQQAAKIKVLLKSHYLEAEFVMVSALRKKGIEKLEEFILNQIVEE